MTSTSVYIAPHTPKPPPPEPHTHTTFFLNGADDGDEVDGARAEVEQRKQLKAVWVRACV